MPVRDVETFFGVRDVPPRVLSNRGANGIDGLVSTAYGAAATRQGPVVLLLGDVALAHDIGGLFAARRASADLRVICLNNGGGGIFDFLPLAEHADSAAYEEHIATPVDVDLGALAPEVREIRTDRATNVELHRQAVERLERAL